MTAPTLRRWRCYRCGKAFMHGRYLATHLIEMHAEAAR